MNLRPRSGVDAASSNYALRKMDRQNIASKRPEFAPDAAFACIVLNWCRCQRLLFSVVTSFSILIHPIDASVQKRPWNEQED